jgi:MFS family permease
MSKTVRIISRNVWVLSLVSLFNDASSEMLIPVMPLYLKSIGFGIVLIGVLEGFAEAAAGLSKGYFGSLSDNTGRRLPFVQLGYLLSNISKTAIAAFTIPLWVFFARFGDKLGKGIRTGARDAILSDEATPETKATVFGFNKALDTLGAVIGPLAALIYLQYYPENYRMLFLIAFIPGIIAVGITFLVKEKRKPVTVNQPKTKFFDFIKYWKDSPLVYKKLVVGLLVFTLFNSSDIFLLLKIKEAGFSDSDVLIMYIFYNLVFALASYPIGKLADKIGKKTIFVIGLVLFVLVYAGMAIAKTEVFFLALFFLYGLYAAATDGVSKAWITNVCEKDKTATAVGTYTAFQSIATLVASSLAGIIWFSLGAPVTFLLSAGVVLCVALYVSTIKE